MAAPPDGEVLRAHGLHHAYGPTPALWDIGLHLREGEVLAITGPRGSGKSTLLHCLSGRLRPTGGEIFFRGKPLHSLGRGARERLRLRHFGWIDSSPRLVPELTVRENTALPLLLHGAGHRAARKAAHEWLDRLGVASCARHRPADLAQDQRQRVAVARALVHSPAVLFADEPTAPLHRSDRAQILRTLAAAARSHRITVVLTTHDLALTHAARTADVTGAALADRRMALDDGRRVRGLSPGPAPLPAPGEGEAACSLSV